MNRISLYWLACIIAAVIYAWLDTILFPFVFDDFTAIVHNIAVQSPEPWLAIWRYAPERWLGFATFVINFKLHGLNAGGFHLFNLFLHMAAVSAYFLFAQRLISAFGIGMHIAGATGTFATVLFALHPIQTAAVTYVHQRLAIVPTFLYFTGLYLWLGYLKKHKENTFGRNKTAKFLWAGVMACGLAGMFSKEMFATFPLAVLTIDWLTQPSGGLWARDRWRRLLPVLLLLCVIPLSIATRYGSVASRLQDYGEAGVTSLIYLATQVGVFWRYIGLIAFMLPQNADHDIPWQTSWLDPAVVGAAAGIACLLGSAFYLRKRRPVFSAGILLMFVGLLVESTVIPIKDAMFEHRMYLSSGGLFLAVADICSLVVVRGQSLVRRVIADPAPRLITVFMGAMAASSLVAATMKRNEVWSSSISLWADVIAKSPLKSRGYINLASSLIRDGKPDEAILVTRKLLDFSPQNADGHFSAALAKHAIGESNQAEEHLEKLTALVSSDDPRIPYLRAKLMIRKRLLVEAHTELEKCFRLLEAMPTGRMDFFAAAKIASIELLIGMKELQRARPALEEAVPMTGESAGILLTAARLAFMEGKNLEGEKALARLSIKGPDQSLVAERELGIQLSLAGDKPRAVAVLEQVRRQTSKPDLVTEAFIAANLQTSQSPWSPPENCRDILMAGLGFIDTVRQREVELLNQGTSILCKDNAACSRCQSELDILTSLNE